MAAEKILIVDDEIDVLELCRRILEAKGYQVKTAMNGYEAIRAAKAEDFDLLLTDNQMPGITGLEIAKTLKHDNPNIICITMTGFGTLDIVVEALRIDVDEFVMKPFTPSELSMAITKALEKQRLRRENFRLRSLIPLFELNKSFMGTREVDQLLRRLYEITKQETKADFVWLYTFKNDQINFYSHPEETMHGNEAQQAASYKIAQHLLTSQQLTTLNEQALIERQIVTAADLAAQSVLAVLLRSQNTNLGAIILLSQKNEFAPSDSEFLSVMCGQASIALENARFFEELKTLDHMKSEFINIAAHELRTPLTILMGYTSILQDVADESQQEFVAPVMRNAERLRSLIDDMLNLKYLASGVPKIEREAISLRHAVETVIKDMDLKFKEKNLTVTVQIPDNFPTMITDPKKLDLILVNLLDNAVKFNVDNGKIILKATHDDSYATISVIDTGEGIPEEQFNRIFKEFVTLEPSLTRTHQGIGLGLAIVRGMVNVGGGQVLLESKEGHGSNFTFTLPLDNSDIKESRLMIW